MEFEWLFWLVVLGIERIGKRGGDGGLGGSLLQERVVQMVMRCLAPTTSLSEEIMGSTGGVVKMFLSGVMVG